MLNCAPSGSLQELARALMRLNALWTDVYNRVDHYSQLFSTSDTQWKKWKSKSKSNLLISLKAV